MRYLIMALCLLLGWSPPAFTQVSVGISLPGISIGINLPAYPELVRVPGYPVYYAPRLDANYFFYDGMYWLFSGDGWYASYWYNGPWDVVYPEYVPVFILRVPVYYYRRPPVYFRDWQRGAPPRWGQHWGRDWERRHGDWDKWDRRSAPAPAPLPVYQKQYSGERYPAVDQQPRLHQQHYRYEPRDAVVREQYQRQRGRGAAPAQEQPRGKAREPQHEPQYQRPAFPAQNNPAGTRIQTAPWRNDDDGRTGPPAPGRQQQAPAGHDRQAQPQDREWRMQGTHGPDVEAQNPKSAPKPKQPRRPDPEDEKGGQGNERNKDKMRHDNSGGANR